jgi:hypothetical protein
MMKRFLLFSLFGIGLIAASQSSATAQMSNDPESTGIGRELVIYLDAKAGTWRPRGRVSFGIVPSLRMKLTSAGFAVTQDPETPHDLVLKVDYREERGKQISINLFGTEITCVIRLDSPQRGRLLYLKIHETPTYAELVTAPYVEVVEKFQTNPYFYFLGDLVWGLTEGHLDSTGALIRALDRQIDDERRPRAATALDTLESPAETFPDLDLHYASMAQVNTVEELGRLKDARAIGVLEQLLFHPARETRLRAVLALREFDAPTVGLAMKRLVQSESDSDVRDAAVAALTRLSMP